MSSTAAAALLRKIFVCITFHWEVSRLATLKLVLQSYASFPTETTVCLITNQPEYVRLALESPTTPFKLCGNVTALGHSYHLAWVHREVMAQVHAEGNHSLFIYSEEDMLLTWPTLQAWAEDEVLLSPLGYHRGLVRVESAAWSGELMAFDQTGVTAVDGPSTKALWVPVPPEVALEQPWRNKTAHFIHLGNPYFAMWLGSREQVAEWMQAGEWAAQNNLDKSINMLREEAAWNLYRVVRQNFSLKTGFFNSAVIPYDPRTFQLLPSAAISHLSNNYCRLPQRAAPREFCSLGYGEVLKTEDPQA